MRSFRKRALALTALLSLCSSSVLAWSVALHVATDDHHRVASEGRHGAVALEMALHAHSHGEGTPAHGHPVIGSVTVPLPERTLHEIGSMIGDAPEVVLAPSRRQLTENGSTHDPPRCLSAVPVLRI